MQRLHPENCNCSERIGNCTTAQNGWKYGEIWKVQLGTNLEIEPKGLCPTGLFVTIVE